MDANDRTKAAYTTALESIKAILTLATAILGFEVTFGTSLLVKLSAGWATVVKLSWFILFFAILMGVGSLFSMAGRLGRHPDDPKKEDIYEPEIKWPSALSAIAFVVGVFLMMLVGVFALPASKDDQSKETVSRYPFYWIPNLTPSASSPEKIVVEGSQCDCSNGGIRIMPSTCTRSPKQKKPASGCPMPNVTGK
ncbi:hypothetical protein LMG28727_05555 [Paraburkholderia kirstenboschensis]|uniref:hypothetical protein n=1 Tax=Paraburkholderia kirstenboschensis TaxID=1245436 RepID=UPI000B0BD9AC|nr:hypothetical protein [Paraburkholderia kirstenboschensis]CAD6553628.1 hypothetical protein LMG28727_05555 [Paraburkholderia kirstenboschensis]